MRLPRVGLPMFILNLRAAPKNGPVHEWLNRVWEQRESIPRYFSVNPLQAFDAKIGEGGCELGDLRPATGEGR